MIDDENATYLPDETEIRRKCEAFRERWPDKRLCLPPPVECPVVDTSELRRELPQNQRLDR